jgi:hypothetical protein
MILTRLNERSTPIFVRSNLWCLRRETKKTAGYDDDDDDDDDNDNDVVVYTGRRNLVCTARERFRFFIDKRRGEDFLLNSSTRLQTDRSKSTNHWSNCQKSTILLLVEMLGAHMQELNEADESVTDKKARHRHSLSRREPHISIDPVGNREITSGTELCSWLLLPRGRDGFQQDCPWCTHYSILQYFSLASCMLQTVV